MAELFLCKSCMLYKSVELKTGAKGHCRSCVERYRKQQATARQRKRQHDNVGTRYASGADSFAKYIKERESREQ